MAFIFLIGRGLATNWHWLSGKKATRYSPFMLLFIQGPPTKTVFWIRFLLISHTVANNMKIVSFSTHATLCTKHCYETLMLKITERICSKSLKLNNFNANLCLNQLYYFRKYILLPFLLEMDFVYKSKMYTFLKLRLLYVPNTMWNDPVFRKVANKSLKWMQLWF